MSKPDESTLYQHRFGAVGIDRRIEVWRVLVGDFFQNYIPADARVLDLGAGYCEFINEVEAGNRVAFDLNPDAAAFAVDDVRVVRGSALELPFRDSAFDVVFTSNFFEHLRSKKDVLDVLRRTHQLLAPGGRLLVLQPNIRAAFRTYWDHLDHHLPFSERSMSEALSLAGFEIDEVRARFLPYSMNSRLPIRPWLIKLYLHFPPAWFLLGRQMFIAAHRP